MKIACSGVCRCLLDMPGFPALGTFFMGRLRCRHLRQEIVR